MIPADWRVATLGELCNFENGDRGVNYPSGSDFVLSGVPFVNAGHLKRGIIAFDRLDFITRSKFETLGNGKFQPGDVLFCLRGSLGKFAVVGDNTPEGAVASSLIIIRPRPKSLALQFLVAYLDSKICGEMIELWAGGAAQPNLGGRELARFLVPVPPNVEEQHSIASALADADALIAALEGMIAKKRDLKQATMQHLLTGKTRLPGFSGEWEVKRLGDVASIKTGKRNNQDKHEDGAFPFFVRSETVERINSYSHDCEAILIPGEGNIGSIFHYIVGKFDVHQRVYAITNFIEGVSGKYVHLWMRMNFGAHAMQNTVKATVDSLRLPTFQNFELMFPPSFSEQTAIAEVLSDMDADLAALEAQAAKARAVKQGMMQELLTGRVRLV